METNTKLEDNFITGSHSPENIFQVKAPSNEEDRILTNQHHPFLSLATLVPA